MHQFSCYYAFLKVTNLTYAQNEVSTVSIQRVKENKIATS